MRQPYLAAGEAILLLAHPAPRVESGYLTGISARFSPCPHHGALDCGEGEICTYSIAGIDELTLSVVSISLSNLSGLKDRLRALVLDGIDDGPELAAEAAA